MGTSPACNRREGANVGWARPPCRARPAVREETPMSVRVMADVWEFGPLDPTDRMVLLYLADRADPDGENCFPSMEQIAKCVCRSKSTVVRCVAALEAAGWLRVDRGVGRGVRSQF